MFGSLGSGIVKPDSQPPSPWSHVLPPPPNPPPPPPPSPAVVSAPVEARRAALSPGNVTGCGAAVVESAARPVVSRPVVSRPPADPPRPPGPPCRLTLFWPPSGAVLGP